ncbi:MAG: hypothetical protein ACTSRC_18190 [Candidatus Helarchaeota archaeon]
MKQDCGRVSMLGSNKMNNEVPPRPAIDTIKEQKISTFNEQVFQNFKNLINSLDSHFFQEHSELELLMYLGGLLNDSIYKQQKYFRTAGLIRQVAPLATVITDDKVNRIYQKCRMLQKIISQKEMRKMPLVIKELDQQMPNIEISSKQNQLNMNSALVAGYNYYGVAVKAVLEGELKPIGEGYHLQEDLKLPNYVKDTSFHFGLYLARYFFMIEELQRKKLKTSSLIKKLHSILKQGTLRSAEFLIRELNLVSLKLLGFSSTSESNKEIKSELSGSQYQTVLFKLMMEKFNDVSKIEKNSLLLGFGTGFTTFNFPFSQKDPFEIPEDINPVLDANGNRIILEEYFIEEFNKKFRKTNALREQIGFLQGILLKSLSSEEKQRLKTNRLIKQFNFLFRCYSSKNMIKIQNEIYHALLSLWMNELIKHPNLERSSFALRFYRIRMKLISLLGKIDLNDEREDPAAILALMQGFELFGKLYMIYNPK